MKKFTVNLLLITLIMLLSFPLSAQVKYPKTKKKGQKDVYFDVKVKDPYRWLEDDKSSETAEWVKNQNKATQDYLSKIPYRDSIRHTLVNMWRYEKYGLPIIGNNYIVYSKNPGVLNQSIIYKRMNGSNEESILIDPNKLSDKGTSAISNISIQKDGKYIAYCVAQNGSDWNEIHVVQEKGNQLRERITGIKFTSIAWLDEGFYYSRYRDAKVEKSLTSTNENQSVFYHRIGSQMEEDRNIYTDPSHPKRTYSVSIPDGERYLILYTTESTSGNALSYMKVGSETQEFTTIVREFKNDYHVLGDNEENLLILTNENAPNYKIAKYNVNENKWSDLIPQKSDVLQSATVSGDKMITVYMRNAISVLVIYDLNGNQVSEIKLPEMGNISGISGKRDNPNAYFSFNTFTTPTTIYSLNSAGGEHDYFLKPTLNLPEVDLTTEQVFYTSKDGVKIPMFIVHKRGITLDSNNAVLLYGYGGFNISLTPSFSVSRMLFLANGGIYAVANIRGGGEFGRKWHEQGTLLNKQNTFDDFIAAAEYLITNKYTNPQKLAISGGSNGGLLVGACMTQRPELFKVALPAVGVLDMLRYHKFTIGYSWHTDYGTSDDKVQFNYLYKYSPLHNIKKRVVYPATFVTTGDHDDRVVPAHSFKFIATLQKKGKHKNPMLIRIETDAGHGAGKPTFKAIDEAADVYAFTFYNLGMKFEPKYYR